MEFCPVDWMGYWLPMVYSQVLPLGLGDFLGNGSRMRPMGDGEPTQLEGPVHLRLYARLLAPVDFLDRPGGWAEV